jgi:hypothetical protein
MVTAVREASVESGRVRTTIGIRVVPGYLAHLHEDRQP